MDVLKHMRTINKKDYTIQGIEYINDLEAEVKRLYEQNNRNMQFHFDEMIRMESELKKWKERANHYFKLTGDSGGLTKPEKLL